MGQSFYVACLSKGQQLTHNGGKLGEDLFDGTPAALVELLAVPLRPPNASVVIQTKVNKVDDGVHPPKRRKLGKANSSTLAISEPARPTRPIPHSSTGEGHRGTFLSLPYEIHRKIFDGLEYIEDVLTLGLVSPYFWTLARPHIQNFHMAGLGIWAGESIIAVGEYIKAADFPPAFTCKMKRQVQQAAQTIRSLVELRDADQVTLVHYVQACREVDAKISVELLGALMSPPLFKEYCYRSHAADIYKTVRPRVSDFYPVNRPWILRNLTTKQYVRSEAIALSPEYVHGPRIDVIGFGEVVLSRVCWSSNPNVGINGNGNLHRGIWAGHYLDIIPWDVHEHELNRAEEQLGSWTDISEEVARDITRIWESRYGSGWRSVCAR